VDNPIPYNINDFHKDNYYGKLLGSSKFYSALDIQEKILNLKCFIDTLNYLSNYETFPDIKTNLICKSVLNGIFSSLVLINCCKSDQCLQFGVFEDIEKNSTRIIFFLSNNFKKMLETRDIYLLFITYQMCIDCATALKGMINFHKRNEEEYLENMKVEYCKFLNVFYTKYTDVKPTENEQIMIEFYLQHREVEN
jgi:hypothetical protein